MVHRTCVIRNRLGLHARAASQLVGVSQEYSATITLRCGEKTGNAKSIMSVLMLQATQGTELEVEAEGGEAEEAVSAIEALIEDLFGEGE
ncbi:MAG: HPr family phosphocarrier protein [Gammaproteobacteria bacterium]|nr:HPr family phosphocarrier protein [Gammaproteobacteria bacterium]